MLYVYFALIFVINLVPLARRGASAFTLFEVLTCYVRILPYSTTIVRGFWTEELQAEIKQTAEAPLLLLHSLYKRTASTGRNRLQGLNFIQYHHSWHRSMLLPTQGDIAAVAFTRHALGSWVFWDW